MHETTDGHSTRHARALADALHEVLVAIDQHDMSLERISTIRPTTVLAGPVDAVLLWIRGARWDELMDELAAERLPADTRRSLGGRGWIVTRGIVELHLWPVRETHFRSDQGMNRPSR